MNEVVKLEASLAIAKQRNERLEDALAKCLHLFECDLASHLNNGSQCSWTHDQALGTGVTHEQSRCGFYSRVKSLRSVLEQQAPRPAGVTVIGYVTRRST